ncbi:MAG: hypothetical protein RIC06_02140 [Cyclobacteriaceae bacterium]
MKLMNIAVKKVELIEWLTRIEDKSLLDQVDTIKKKAIAESYEAKQKPMSSSRYKSLLDQAEEEYKNGKVTSQEDLEKESENW